MCISIAYYICWMKISQIIVLVIPFAVLIGCDVVQKADGIVLDKNSRKPIKGINIGQSSPDSPEDEYYDSDIHHSDSTGQFHYYHIGGSGSFQLYFYKGGYTTVKRNYKGTPEHDTIWMVSEIK